MWMAKMIRLEEAGSGWAQVGAGGLEGQTQGSSHPGAAGALPPPDLACSRCC